MVSECQGHEGGFWGAGSVLHLDLGYGNVGGMVHPVDKFINLPTYDLCASLCEFYINKNEKKKVTLTVFQLYYA